MLIVAADRGVQAFGQLLGCFHGIAKHDTTAVQDDGKFGIGQKFGCTGNGILAACRALKIDNRRQVDFNNLGPEVARDIDLGRRRSALGPHYHSIENLGHTGWVAYFFLIGNYVLEHGHLGNLLKTALSHGHVGGLGGYQQKRRVVPIGDFCRGNKIGDTRTVLANQHTHFPGSARKSVRHHAAAIFMAAIPERDTSCGKQVGNRHQRRTNNAKRIIDAMHLQDLDKSFFGCHFDLSHDLPPKVMLFLKYYSFCCRFNYFRAYCC